MKDHNLTEEQLAAIQYEVNKHAQTLAAIVRKIDHALTAHIPNRERRRFIAYEIVDTVQAKLFDIDPTLDRVRDVIELHNSGEIH